jgi:hypothetical protein
LFILFQKHKQTAAVIFQNSEGKHELFNTTHAINIKIQLVLLLIKVNFFENLLKILI